MSQTIDVKRYEELARQKQGEHRKFLAQLKKKAPKNLDKIVQQVHNEVFQEIDCTQCANCCKTLGPDFTEQDITRIAKHFRMKLPAFEEMYLQVDEDGDKVSSLCLVHSWGLIISVISMMSAPRLVQLFPTRIVRKSIRSII